jgi:hypothetical protein
VSDFFDNLIARATTQTAVVRPRIVPRFAQPTPESFALSHESEEAVEQRRESSPPDARTGKASRTMTQAAHQAASLALRSDTATHAEESRPTHSEPATHNDVRAANAAAMSQFPPQANERIEAQVVDSQPLRAIQPRSITTESQHESSAQAPTVTHNALEPLRGEPVRREPPQPSRDAVLPRRAIEVVTTHRVERIQPGLRESSVRARAAREDAPQMTQQPPAPTIQVTIGRIEVRAEPPQPLPRRATPAAPRLTLDEYLRQRSGGER